MQLVLADSFFDSFVELDKIAQKAIKGSIKKLAVEPKTSGLSIHNLDRANCDKSFRSARVNRDLRLIFSQKDNKLIVLHVGRHDDAYDWADGKFLKVTPYGALYTTQEVGSRKSEDDPINDFLLKSKLSMPSVLSKMEITRGDLEKLGLGSVQAERLMQAESEDALLFEMESLPAELQEGILDIATGNKTVTQLYAELFEINDITTADVLANPNSKRRFYLCKDAEEIDSLLGNDAKRWQLFLHPQQEKIVKSNYNGPVLIEGGPGTGKSIVGVHRAVYLADKVWPKGRILFTTFSVKLASYMRMQLSSLAETTRVNVETIDVYGVDKLLRDIAVANGLLVCNVNVDAVAALLKKIYIELSPKEPLSFYQIEYAEVIQRFKIRSSDQYLQVSRSGMGKALNPSERKKVWSFFSTLLEAKKCHQVWDFDDLAWAVHDAVENEMLNPIYDSIIIDEAQDLTIPRISALLSLTQQEQNNVMLLSDRNQRIYRLNTWSGDLGVAVAGRTFHLNINYRTTREIREYADAQFIKTQLDKSCLKEYKSLFSGPYPIVESFSDQKTQMKFIVAKIQQMLGNGYDSSDVCIVSPHSLKDICAILRYEGIAHTLLEKDVFPTKSSGLCVSSMEGCKGLEFRVVIACNFNDVRPNNSLDGEGETDWISQLEMRKSECAKYVACTRAREELYIALVNANHEVSP